jgi:hypothetical protein
MPKKPKKERMTEYPVQVRLTPELHRRMTALVPKVGTRSTVLRLALLEGLKVLERRWAET